VTVEEDLGEIQLIKIEKRKYWYQDDWYLKHVTVKTPLGDYLEFPCYRWITDEKEVVLRDGRGEHHKKPPVQHPELPHLPFLFPCVHPRLP